jgi:hypothetical protein
LCGGNFPNGNKFIRRIYDLGLTIYEFFLTAAASRVHRRSSIVNQLEFRFNAAGAEEAPARDGFKNGEQAGSDENQSHPPLDVASHNDAGDEAKRANDAARHPPLAIQIGLEKLAHAKKIAVHAPIAKLASVAAFASSGSNRFIHRNLSESGSAAKLTDRI